MTRATAFAAICLLTLAASVAGTPREAVTQKGGGYLERRSDIDAGVVVALPAAPVGASIQAKRQVTGVRDANASMPAPSGEASSFVVAAPALRHGVLSYVDAKYGADYLALPEPRGTVAEICGPGGCVTRRSNDYGPDQRVHPNRIADLSAADFVFVCGVPLSAGLCEGTVELEPPVDPADDAARAEDGGPAPTLPPTDTLGVR